MNTVGEYWDDDYQTTRGHILEVTNLSIHQRDNLKIYTR